MNDVVIGRNSSCIAFGQRPITQEISPRGGEVVEMVSGNVLKVDYHRRKRGLVVIEKFDRRQPSDSALPAMVERGHLILVEPGGAHVIAKQVI